MQKDESIRLLDFVMITLGCCLYGLGLAVVNIPNHLAEGGITGVTLILRALFGIDPALSTLLINVPLILIGYRFLGKRSLIYTIFGKANAGYEVMVSASILRLITIPVIQGQSGHFLKGTLNLLRGAPAGGAPIALSSIRLITPVHSPSQVCPLSSRNSKETV